MRKGMLIVLSGPSGVGKGTVCNALFAQDALLTFSVSVTTRAPRPGEKDGVNYFYRTQEEFDAMAREGRFLEYSRNFGMSCYGTPADYVEQKRAEGFDVVLDIDVKGAAQVKEKCKDAVFVFIAPPSMEALENRLRGRGTEGEESIRRRLREASVELGRIGEYDYLVINDVLQTAVGHMHSIIDAERLKTSRNASRIEELQGGK